MSVSDVDILVLGAGWTSQFFVELFNKEKITHALTTTTGKINKTCEGKYEGSKIIQFAFVPDQDPRPDNYDENFVEEQYFRLPRAKTVIVTFKLEGKGQSEKLIRMYSKSHPHLLANFIQLGSTGIFKEERLHTRDDNTYDDTPRAIAEDEFIEKNGSVLALAGLWGDERVPWNWISKVASTKEKLSQKKALHLIHGWDVARACLCMHYDFYPGDRSIITDGMVYDWWVLVEWFIVTRKAAFTSNDVSISSQYQDWLSEIRREHGITGPRSQSELGRVLNSDAFWKTHRTQPEIVLGLETRYMRDLHTKRTPLENDQAASDRARQT